MFAINFKTVQPVRSDAQIQRSKCESYIEARLYDALVYRGYNVHTQVNCGPYRIDLTVPSLRLAIECDGKDYHSSPEQKKHDRRKNAYLRKHGWKVMRFSGRQINRELPRVLAKIESAIS
ncbi:endonuclease domain-containing protein [Heyndrickxia sporothermodurans]|uniref:endonuclease domain-containing protein n=2 Tax=Heyndrickxia TaxID=2837504 RepID=UPI001FD4F235|nr:DUF559 domain-containing protein [Heyndrickxia sporothermodurans]